MGATVKLQMQTYSGKRFDWENISSEAVNIVDVAHALGMICRFTGSVLRFYSVAEHSIHVCDLAPPELKLDALLHDAAEAYIGDIARGLKDKLREVAPEGMGRFEHDVETAVASAFRLTWPPSKKIKEIDNRLLATERKQLMAPVDWDWNPLPEPYPDLEIVGFGPAEATYWFLDRYRKLVENGRSH